MDEVNNSNDCAEIKNNLNEMVNDAELSAFDNEPLDSECTESPNDTELNDYFTPEDETLNDKVDDESENPGQSNVQILENDETNNENSQSESEESFEQTANESNDAKDDSNETHECGTCNKAFTDSRRLNRHKKIHLTKKPYNCKICNKGFNERADLTRHMARHQKSKSSEVNKEYSFRCGECNQGFNFKRDMEIHESIHTTSGVFGCSGCGKVFQSESSISCDGI